MNMIPDRRNFLKGAVASIALGRTSLAASMPSNETSGMKRSWFLPNESHRHRRTWMAFGASERIWGDLLPYVRGNLALIARTVARYEPVTLLVRPNERGVAARMCGDKVRLIETCLDDLWIRDIGPVFVINQTEKSGAVDLNFNGWGRKQAYDNDAEVARFISRQADAELITTRLVGEGGGIEVDGHGTAIITESCFLNHNRNPGLEKAECERILKSLFGIRRVIWLPGVRDKDITDGHTDFYARFARRGVVVAGLEMDRHAFDYDVTREHLKILKAARDADGRKLEIVTLESPGRIRHKLETEDFAAGYINYYVINGAVLAPEFGDARTDVKCKDVLGRLFPKYEIVQLNIDAIAAGGGGIHCATLHEPLPARSSAD